MKAIVFIVVGVICGVILKSWTKHTYYKGMKAGVRIAEGVKRGRNVGDLHKVYDRYWKGET